MGVPMHDESVKVLHKENAGDSTMVALAWPEGQFPVSNWMQLFLFHLQLKCQQCCRWGDWEWSLVLQRAGWWRHWELHQRPALR